MELDNLTQDQLETSIKNLQSGIYYHVEFFGGSYDLHLMSYSEYDEYISNGGMWNYTEV
jgi:hypothetical protein